MGVPVTGVTVIIPMVMVMPVIVITIIVMLVVGSPWTPV